MLVRKRKNYWKIWLKRRKKLSQKFCRKKSNFAFSKSSWIRSSDALQGLRETELDRAREVWRKKFGQLDTDEVKRLKALETENARLKKMLVDRDLEIEVMKEINAKKW
jgi:putative transposase